MDSVLNFKFVDAHLSEDGFVAMDPRERNTAAGKKFNVVKIGFFPSIVKVFKIPNLWRCRSTFSLN